MRSPFELRNSSFGRNSISTGILDFKERVEYRRATFKRRNKMARHVAARRLVFFAVLATFLLFLAMTIAGQQGAPANGEWRRIGGDGGSTRYSPLDQINAQNVKNLKVAWTWKGDNYGSGLEIKNENTPLMVDGVLYFTA